MTVRLSTTVLALVGLASFATLAHAGSTSPCRLATITEVKAAFGGTVGPGRVDTSLIGAPTCHYAVKGSNLGLSGDAVVFVTPGQTPATFALAKKLVPGAVAVPGVGTAAFYNPHTTSVELLKGTAVASAQAIFLDPGGPPPDPAKTKADTIVLAKAVAKHL
jgi:hypothetical protein